jgi:multiple sugar transport system substrate-binding protein
MSDTKDAPERAVSRRSFLATTALAGVGVASSGALLSACGGGGGKPGGGSSGGGAKGGGTVSWESWSNGPAEGEQHKQFSQEYEKMTGTKIVYQIVAGDYLAKILTQLAGNTAPDAFYIGDTSLAKLIDNKAVEPLDDFLATPDAGLKFEDTYPGLGQWCKGTDGKVYGIPVDCNPKVMWFNKVLLSAAGVSQDPAAAFDGGAWTQQACTDMFSKVTQSGKRAAVVENNWFDTLSWLTTFGGKAFDDKGKAIFDTDEKSKAAGAWMIDQMKSGNIVYGGALPKGQAANALFYAGQLATLGYGRWELPNIDKLPKSRMDYDIAPLPSPDGKTVMPVAVYTAAMAVNAKAKNKEGAQKFLAYYCGQEGMKKRLTAGGGLGNAVPSRTGLDDTVTSGGKPAHAKVFLETAKNGYATPLILARSADKSAKIGQMLDSMLLPDPLKSLTADKFLTTYANYLNG